jgi:hypothetical protein
MAKANAAYNSAWLTKACAPPQKPKAPLTKRAVARALRRAFGNHGRAAALLGVTRQRIQQIVSSEPDLSALAEEARELHGDLGEDVVLHAMKQGDSSVARWFLEKSQIGKRRGYGSSTEINFGDEDLALLARSLGRDIEEARRFDAALDITPAQKQVAAQADDRSRDSGRSG